MSQNLQNVVKFQKFQLENLVDFEKCCKTHIYLQKSEPIQPKTSNILPKFCQPTLSDVSASEPSESAPRSFRACQKGDEAVPVGEWVDVVFPAANATVRRDVQVRIFRKFCKFLAGSFSAVSKRNFARKYAFDSIFQALQDLHTFAPPQSQDFSKKSV